MSTFFSFFVDFDRKKITRDTASILYRLGHQYELRDLQYEVEQFIMKDADKKDASIKILISYLNMLTINQAELVLYIGKRIAHPLILFLEGDWVEQDLTKEMFKHNSSLEKRRMDCFLYLTDKAKDVDLKSIQIIVSQRASNKLASHILESTDIRFLFLVFVNSLDPRSEDEEINGW